MPIVRSSLPPHGQNLKIPKIDFCDVITSVLYCILSFGLAQFLVRITAFGKYVQVISFIGICRRQVLKVHFVEEFRVLR